MAKQELYERSPIRIFDEAANGGLKAGELGLVTAKKGLGKTSVLVQFGMDTLLNGKQLVHVSFNQHSENVISWYDGIYNEISKKKAIANAADVKEQILRNRTILNFNQDNISLEKVVNTLNALKAGGTAVAGVVIDDVDFSKVKEADLQTVASYAKVTKTKIWFSSTSVGDKLEDSAPKALLPYFSAVIHLSSKNSVTQLSILKMGKNTDIETTLKLDSKTLLITNNK
ncbi:ATPase domain-containing protein [Treponema sp. UBA6852]|uniref:ATPase domain-containing protein n=1 Tax=Treponema sp. UBA6852 TaxID=1947744 RepID=UPI0025CF3583|nr:ATPase domain-containing protein [Treponema sp. UBA6852]